MSPLLPVTGALRPSLTAPPGWAPVPHPSRPAGVKTTRAAAEGAGDGGAARGAASSSRRQPLYPPQPLTPAAQRTMDFLRAVGADAIAHSGGTAFSTHLRGVYDVLAAWGAPEPLCLAGLAHSVYATDGFQHPSCLSFSPDNRRAVRGAIGDEAEAIVYAFCVTDRATAVGEAQDDDLAATRAGDPPRTHRWRVRADAGPHVREEWVEMGHDAWTAFTTLTLADWLEQVEEAATRGNARFGYGPGEAWAYRRRAYAHMAGLLGGVAAADYARVFGREPEGSRGLEFQRPVVVG